VILETDDEASSNDDMVSNDEITSNEFPAGDEMFQEIDKVVFKIHTKGYFEYDPLRKKSLVTGGRKGKEKVIEDEGICKKGSKADVSIYKRDMVNGKAKMVEDVGAVKRGKERCVIIKDCGFSNDGGKETMVTKRAIGSRKMEGKSVKVSYPRGRHGSWYVSVFTLRNMYWKKLDNDSLPKESIRFKHSSQVVVDETDCFLCCGWSVLVDVTSLTSFTLLFAIPTPNYVKLLGFTNDEILLPIVEAKVAGTLVHQVSYECGGCYQYIFV
nr:hypothetical protein [Tanacetum cinerariifolium]